jgi:hypothetical protein
MIILPNTSTTIQVVSNGTTQIAYTAEYDDLSSAALVRGTSTGKISTAATTFIVASPASSTERSVKQIILKNIDVTNGAVLLQKFDGTNAYDLIANVTLTPQQSLVYIEDAGFQIYGANGILLSSDTTNINFRCDVPG